MDGLASGSLLPRKTAVQARSRATIAAISEATIQVLLTDGSAGLTTTRVAQRAGVSVGSLYQYYPNKHSLLFAILGRKFDRVADAMEAACLRLAGRPLATMVDGLVSAYVTVKTERVDVSLVLYAVADAMDTAGLVAGLTKRTEAAVAAMLATAPDARIADPGTAAFMVIAVLSGVVRAAFERGDTGGVDDMLRRQICAVCLGYLQLEDGRGPWVPTDNASPGSGN